jgi:glycosyltransferase involved in cell wall biosynthesis
MKVCIGITTKNRCDILPKAIESALQQDYDDKEVVIFDDGSTDKTDSIKDQFPEVRWMQSEHSIGLLEARNALMYSTDADLYVTLDDDAWFLEGDEIRLAVDEFLKNDKLAVVAFDVLQRGTKRFNPVPRSKPIATNVFIGCGAMLKIKAVLESGNFVAFPVRYGHEEKDLSIRMIDKGYSLVFMPGVHIWHDFTPLERNLESQRTSLITNDLIFQYRRVPSVFVWVVLANNIIRKLRSNDDSYSITKNGIDAFFKQMSSQKDKIQRVKSSTYMKYRKISKSFLAYKEATDQTGDEFVASTIS